MSRSRAVLWEHLHTATFNAKCHLHLQSYLQSPWPRTARLGVLRTIFSEPFTPQRLRPDREFTSCRQATIRDAQIWGCFELSFHGPDVRTSHSTGKKVSHQNPFYTRLRPIPSTQVKDQVCMYLYVWCVCMDMYACLHVQGPEYEHQASSSSLTILFSWDRVPQWTQSWGGGPASSSHPPVSTPCNTTVKRTHRTAPIPAGFLYRIWELGCSSGLHSKCSKWLSHLLTLSPPRHSL